MYASNLHNELEVLCYAWQSIRVAVYRFVFGVFDEGSGDPGIHLRRKQLTFTIVYEAFLQEYEKTVRTVSDFPEMDKISVEFPLPISL